MNVQPNTIIEALNWRYAVQVFDQTKPLEKDVLYAILESARLAPSAIGFEPWKFIVVENPEIRARIQQAGFGQPKITDAPYLVVIAYRTDLNQTLVQERLERTSRIQKQEISELGGLKQLLDGHINSKTEAELEKWAKAQAYIPLGMMIQTAALLGVDSGPMEGFNPDGVDAVLGLKEKNLHATSMIAFGYRGEDPMALRPKVRRDFNEVVEFIK